MDHFDFLSAALKEKDNDDNDQLSAQLRQEHVGSSLILLCILISLKYHRINLIIIRCRFIIYCLFQVFAYLSIIL